MELLKVRVPVPMDPWLTVPLVNVSLPPNCKVAPAAFTISGPEKVLLVDWKFQFEEPVIDTPTAPPIEPLMMLLPAVPDKARVPVVVEVPPAAPRTVPEMITLPLLRMVSVRGVPVDSER